MSEHQGVTAVVVGMYPWAYGYLSSAMQQMARSWARYPDARVFYVDGEWAAKPGERWAQYVSGQNVPHLWRICPAAGSAGVALRDVVAEQASADDLCAALDEDICILYVHSFSPEQCWHLAESLMPDRMVYDCHESVMAWLAPSAAAVHAALVEQADLVVAISEMVAENLGSTGATPLLLGNGVDVDRFASAKRQSRRWTFGFVGQFYAWTDVEALDAVAEAFPSESLVLVGPVQTAMREQLDRLQRHPNVEVHPAVPYAEVPDYLQAMEVCLLPRLLTPASMACDPLKLYEYLAAGRPTVSTALPAALSASAAVYVAESGTGFVRACEQALVEARSGRFQAERQAVGRKLVQDRTWDARAAAVWQALMREAPPVHPA